MSERVYPYAVVLAASNAASINVRGLRGRSVSLLPAGQIGVWASRVAQFIPEPADLLVHHEVVEAVCAAGPALPIRFGSSFPDETALETALSPRTGGLIVALKRVGDMRELAVMLEWRSPVGEMSSESQPPEVSGAGPGRRYIAQRAQRWAALDGRRARATEMAAQLQDALSAGGVVDACVRRRIVPAPRVALSCAVLAEPAAAEDVMRLVRDKAAEWLDVRLHLAGPWPPYSFTDAD
ncbi:MAG: GvpL/GvpF family gas vesicle protein [Chloroflexota bacterium]